jgi:hypothetical protein
MPDFPLLSLRICSLQAAALGYTLTGVIGELLLGVIGELFVRMQSHFINLFLLSLQEGCLYPHNKFCRYYNLFYKLQPPLAGRWANY